MARVMFSGRLEEEDVRWLKGYAVQRDTTASAVLQKAVSGLRARVTGGVPDLPIERRTPPRPSRRPASSSLVPEGPDIGPTPEGMDFHVHHALVRQKQAAARNARMREKGSR